jgi:UDP-N-acetylmuramyl pentapeptide phosphotransferase/UDP-N-acetylglucosamine-1-phosphate transferase
MDNFSELQLTIFATSALVAWASLYPLSMLGRRLKVMDIPGERSSHSVPVPRTGGTGVLLGAMVGVLLFCRMGPGLTVAMGLGGAVVLMSLLDDIFTLPSLPRFLIHILSASLCIYLIRLNVPRLGLPYLQEIPWLAFSRWVGIVVGVFFVVAFLNIFNFMDGINGISASQGMFGAAGLTVLLSMHAQSNSALIAAAIAGGCVGFFPHNFPKARTFLGDIGSTGIGFALAMLTIIGASQTSIPWVAYLLLFAVYIYDGAFTIIKRTLHGENPTKAHREHHYQLLIRSGWSHSAVTGLYTLQFIACSALGIGYARTNSQAIRLAILLGLLAWFVCFSIAVHRHFGNYQKTTPSGDG